MGNKYHAAFVTPDELSQWVEEWTSQNELHTALTLDQVDLLVLDRWTDTPDAQQRLAAHPEMWLSAVPIAIGGRTPVESIFSNRDCLTIQLPKRTPSVLREMLVGWVTTNPAIVLLWKAILSSIRKKTQVYLWDVTYQDGLKKEAIRHRASPQSVVLHKQGVALHDFFGNEFTLHQE
jgi:hypothetical protein